MTQSYASRLGSNAQASLTPAGCEDAHVGEQLSGATVSLPVRRRVFKAANELDVEELTGGVACAVFAVRGEGKRVVVKQALERFRVAGRVARAAGAGR